MKNFFCTNCKKEIIGRAITSYDEEGNLIQLIDFTCPSCYSGWIYNPQL